MSADDKIRRILEAQVDSIEPSPAGWDRIKDGIAVRRRRRLWLRSSAAATVALSLVAVTALVATRNGDDRASEVIEATQVPSPEPTTSPEEGDLEPTAVWPLTNRAEERAWRADGTEQYPYLRDPDEAAAAFAKEYLGIAHPIVESGEDSESTSCCYRYIAREVGPSHRQHMTEVQLNDGRNGRPYHVLSASAKNFDLAITSPTVAGGVGERVSSPLVVRGTFTGVFTGVDQVIDVALRAAPSAGGAEPAKIRAQIDGNEWSATLTFSTTASTGSVLVTTYSGADGGIGGAWAIPVGFETAADAPTVSPTTPRPDGTYPAQFVAIAGGQVAVFDTRSGALVRYLSGELPDGGAADPFVTDDRKHVVYAQLTGSCGGSIRRVPIEGGPAETLFTSRDGREPSSPRVSVDGTLAYALTTCRQDGRYDSNADSVLVVGSKQLPARVGDHATIGDLAWSSDGDRLAVVVHWCCDANRFSQSELYEFEPDTVQRVTDVKPYPRPTDYQGTCGWTGVGYTYDGRLLATEGCPPMTEGDPSTSRLRDLSSNRVVLDTRGSGVPGLLDVDPDTSGDHLLLDTLHGCEDSEDCVAEPAAYRFSVDGKPVKVADNLTQPSWVG